MGGTEGLFPRLADGSSRSARGSAVYAHVVSNSGAWLSPSRSRTQRYDVLEAPSRQNLKRVRPPGSVLNATVAERGSTRYTCHGGGPCDGALNGAVMPDPLSSGSAGQPVSAHALAARATTAGSVTRAASPSMTTSASRIDELIEQRASRATLAAFRVPEPVWNQNAPSSQRAPTAVTCGLPSLFTVASQVVRALCAS